jgi:hypothetical protein
VPHPDLPSFRHGEHWPTFGDEQDQSDDIETEEDASEDVQDSPKDSAAQGDFYLADEFAPDSLAALPMFLKCAESVSSLALMTDYEPDDIFELLKEYSIITGGYGGGGGENAGQPAAAPHPVHQPRALSRLRDFLTPAHQQQPLPDRRGGPGPRRSLRNFIDKLAPSLPRPTPPRKSNPFHALKSRSRSKLSKAGNQQGGACVSLPFP